MQNFLGRDGFIWFTGVVEDRQDPDKLGRVRVRCVGYHTDDKNKIPTADLPWSWVMMPTTTSSMNGIGQTPPLIVEGSWVVGFWRDPDTMQEPVVMGTLPGIPEQFGNSDVGFHDPRTTDTAVYGPYPIRIGESDMNRRATGTDHLAETRQAEIYSNIGTADGETWAEPSNPYEGVYPYNHVYETESGHIREFDDTQNRTRIHERHRSGSYYEIDDGGNKVLKIVGDGYEIIAGSRYAYVKGNCNLTIDSNCNTNIKGNYILNVDKDMVVNVGGTLKETVKGAVTEIYEDTKTENVKKAVVEVYEDTKNESVTKKVTETFAEGQQTSITGEYDLDVTDAVSIESDSTIKINQPGATQNAARKGDTADTGDAGGGSHFDVNAAGTDVIETGSGTVFIGDTGATELADPTPAPEVDPNPVSTAETAFGVSGTGMSETRAREIIQGRNDDIAAGLDVDSNEPFEVQSTDPAPISDNDGNNFTNASTSDTNLVDENNNTDLTQKNFDGKLLNFLSHTDPRISDNLRTIMENVAKEYGQTLTITSAYRSPAYNAKVGGVKKSQHSLGTAVDVRMSNTSVADRQRFMEIAVKHGIQGIGAYFPSSSGGVFIHCDIGGKRQWGPSGSRRSSYGWQRETLSKLGYLV